MYIYILYMISLYAPVASLGFNGGLDSTNHESVKQPTLKRNCRLGTWEPNLVFGEAPDPHVLDIRPNNVLTSESHFFRKLEEATTDVWFFKISDLLKSGVLDCVF